jgi:hypothetical protein
MLFKIADLFYFKTGRRFVHTWSNKSSDTKYVCGQCLGFEPWTSCFARNLPSCLRSRSDWKKDVSFWINLWMTVYTRYLRFPLLSIHHKYTGWFYLTLVLGGGWTRGFLVVSATTNLTKDNTIEFSEILVTINSTIGHFLELKHYIPHVLSPWTKMLK